MRRIHIALSAAAALVAGALSTAAAQQPSNDQLKQAPDTGVEAPAAQAAPSVLGTRNVGSVAVVRRANGVLQAVLNESFDDALVATRNADGTMTYTCLHGLPAANGHLANHAPRPVSQAPVLEEK